MLSKDLGGSLNKLTAVGTGSNLGVDGIIHWQVVRPEYDIRIG